MKAYLLALFLFCAVLRVQSEDLKSSDLRYVFDISDWTEYARTNQNAFALRMLVDRAFHDPILFEIVRIEDSFYLISKRARRETTGAQLFYSGPVRENRAPLDLSEIKTIKTMLSSADFWSLPESGWRESGLDGSTWKIEVVNDGLLKVVSRDNPFSPFKSGISEKSKEKMDANRAYSEGLLASVFVYVWALSSEDARSIY